MIVLSEKINISENIKIKSEIKVCTQREILDGQSNDVGVIICSRDTARRLNPPQYPNLKLLQLISAGYDMVDVQGYKNRGVYVTNAGDSYAVAMAESVIFSMQIFSKRLNENPCNIRPRICRNYHYIEELCGKTVLICGTGNVGRMLAPRLNALGMTVCGFSAHGVKATGFFDTTADFNKMMNWAESCDYFVNLLPLNEQTKDMIDERIFSRMKRRCVIIGIGRIGTFQKDDLYRYLASKKIRGAVLDIFEFFPNRLTNKFRRLRNVCVLPSIAAVSQETNQRLNQVFVDNIQCIENSEKPRFLLK